MIRLGTRRSPLAQAQADRVLTRLPPGLAAKVVLESEGDRDLKTPVHHLARPGAFTSLLTDAILDGRIDAAVHSLKDLPLRAPDDAPIVAVLPRDDAADVLVARVAAQDPSRPLGLAAGSRVGTSAPRRQSQVLAADPELVPVDVRGNVGTRLDLVARGALDALLLAAAAFERMPLPLPEGTTAQRLDPARFPVGPGQGTIAVQARAGSEAAIILARLDDAPTRAAVELERALLARLGGGCGMPLGAYAAREADGWRLHATLAPDGWTTAYRPRLARADARAATPEAALDAALRELAALPSAPQGPAPARVLAITLDAAALPPYAETLAPAGWRAEPWTLLDEIPLARPPPLPPSEAAWIAVTSPRAVDAVATLGDPSRLPRIAAIGPATARALRAHGLPAHVVSADGTGRGLAAAIRAFAAAPGPVLLPQSARALPDLADALRASGNEPVAWPTYDVRPRDPAPALPTGAEAVLLTSPSNVEAFLRAGAPASLRLVAFGPTTADAMRRARLRVDAVAPRRSPEALLQVLP